MKVQVTADNSGTCNVAFATADNHAYQAGAAQHLAAGAQQGRVKLCAYLRQVTDSSSNHKSAELKN